MAECDVCGEEESMPYHCRHCGGTYCSEHRLPESHDCPGLENWEQSGPVFDSGFDDTIDQSSGSSGLAERLGIDTGTGGPLAYVRGNVTYTFLGLMWVTFALQWVVLLVGGRPLHNDLFTLSTANPEFVWTWITSVFAHSPVNIFHIVFNSIVIYFFGTLVERYVGSRAFAILFVVSGVIAGLGQIAVSLVQSVPVNVLGASGAALAIMGVLTVLNPNLRVYLYFILPVPIWLLTIGTAAISLFFVSTGGGGNVAHAAHLVGLLVGLGYGYRVRDRIRTPSQLQFGGSGPGGPGRGGPGGPGRGRF